MTERYLVLGRIQTLSGRDVPLYTCTVDGCLVTDMRLHDQFHDTLSEHGAEGHLWRAAHRSGRPAPVRAEGWDT